MYVHNRFKFRLSGPPMRDIESIFLFSIYIRGDPASATVPGSTINSFISRWPRIRIWSSWLPTVATNRGSRAVATVPLWMALPGSTSASATVTSRSTSRSYGKRSATRTVVLL